MAPVSLNDPAVTQSSPGVILKATSDPYIRGSFLEIVFAAQPTARITTPLKTSYVENSPSYLTRLGISTTGNMWMNIGPNSASTAGGNDLTTTAETSAYIVIFYGTASSAKWSVNGSAGASGYQYYFGTLSNFGTAYSTALRNAINNDSEVTVMLVDSSHPRIDINNLQLLDETPQTAPAVPSTPTLTTVDTDSLSATWSAVDTADTYQGQYKKSTDTNWTSITGNITSPHQIDSLDSDTAYQFRVRATNAAGSSNYSTPANARTAAPFSLASFQLPAGQLLADATLYNGQRDANNFLYRTDGTPTGSILSGDSSIGDYTFSRIRHPNANQFQLNDNPDARSLADYFAAGGAGRDLTIHIQDETGVASFAVATATLGSSGGNFIWWTVSNAVQTVLARIQTNTPFILAFTRPAPPAPNPPTSPTATATSDTAVSFSWVAPASGSAVDSYEVQFKLATATDWTDATDLSSPSVITGLTPSTAYNFRVRSKNAGGVSAWATDNATTEATPVNPPNAPTSPSATATSDTEVSFTWVAPASGAAVTAYEVQFKKATESSWTDATDVTSPSLITGLDPETPYNFRVRATNAGGESAWVSDDATTQATPSTAPTNLSVTAIDHTTLRLTWDAVTGALRYEVQYRAAGTTNWASQATATTAVFTLRNLQPSSSWDFRVHAIASDGTALDWSDPVSGTTDPPPDLFPAFGAATIADQSWIAGSPITTLTLPAATGGDGTLAYALTPALPDGLSISGRAITGTPTTATAAATYTWKATDADGDEVELTFDITILADLAPTAGNTPDQNFIAGDQQTFTVAASTGGNLPVTTAISGNPANTSFDGSTRVFTVGAMAAHGSYVITVTYTDVDGDSATDTFTLTLAEDLTPTAGSTPDQSFIAGSNNTFTVAAPSGGNLPVATAVAGNPTGTGFDPATRVFTVGSTTAAGTYTITVTYTDADGDAVTDTFDLELEADLAPTAGSTANQTFIRGTTHTFQVAQGSGGNPPIVTTVSGNPANTSFNGSTLTFTVGPTAPRGVHTITVTYTDADGDAVTDSFTLTITQDVDPVPGITPDSTFITGDEHSLTIAAATDGNTPVTVSIAGNPANTVYTTSTRTLAIGANTAPGVYTITVTYTDVDGDTATRDFTLTILADHTPVAGTTPTQVFINDRQHTFTVAAGSSGNPPIAVALSGLPAGATFAPGTRVVTLPTGTAAGTYTITATYTDHDNDSVQSTFQLLIYQDTLPTAGQNPNRQTIQGTAITFPIRPGSGGNPALTTSVAGNPTGTSFNPTTMVFTVGTTAPAGVYAITVTYTDANGDSATDGFVLTIIGDTQPQPGRNRDRNFEIDELFDFAVEPSTGGNLPVVTTVSGLPGGATFSGGRISGSLPTAGAHTVTVTYTDADGDSASDTFTLTIARDRPAAPQAPSLTADHGTIDATWLAPLSTMTITAYEISYGPAATSDRSRAKITNNSHRITGLEAGTEYAVAVRAFAGTVAGDWSEEARITTAASSGTTDPTSDRTASVRLDWQKPDDESINLYQYRVKVS